MRLVVQELRALWAAAMFFTRVPLPSLPGLTADDQRRAIAYWPLVGVAVGAAIAGVWWLAAQVFPPGVSVALAICAGLLLTGALHEDGFADVCDGFGGGTTRDRILDIMRDSGVGAFGAIGLVVLLLLKWQTMAALPPALMLAALIAAHALSRGGAVTLMAALPYARAEGSKGGAMVGKPELLRLIGGGVLALAPLPFLPVRCWWAAVAALVLWVATGLWFRRRIGGYTCDCLGATQQLGEVVILLSVVALA